MQTNLNISAENIPIDSIASISLALIEWIPWILLAIIVFMLLGLASLFFMRNQQTKQHPSYHRTPHERDTGDHPTQTLSLADIEEAVIITTAQLLLKDDPSKEFLIKKFPYTIGSSTQNDLIIDKSFPQYESVSHTHAQIVLQRLNDQRIYVVEDFGSENGVRVNGQPTPQNLLRDSWIVAIGGTEFIFKLS